MITISKNSKCLYVWGVPGYGDTELVESYKSRGYMIVYLGNGTENIGECLRTVVRAGV